MEGEGEWLSHNGPMPGLIAASSFYDTCIAKFFYFLFDRTTCYGEVGCYFV